MPELRTECFVSTVHSAALMLVDYINVDGTLNPQVYKSLGSLSAQRETFEPFLGGDLVADVGVYFDKESLYNPDENKVHVTKMKALDKCPHRDAVVGAARFLQRGHIPFGILTNANLNQISRYRVLVLPTVLEMNASQADIIRKFVEQGGIVLASGVTSLDRRRMSAPAFHLEDVFGVRYQEMIGTRITYLTPRDEGLKRAIWPQDFLSYAGPMVKAEALAGTRVLATITLPFVAPEAGRAIGSHFAAIHSNPPALHPGSDPAVVIHSFGRGKSLWIAAPIESSQEWINGQAFAYLLDQILSKPLRIETDTHPSVEATLFHQTAKKSLLAGFINLETELPQIPVSASVQVMLPEGKSVRSVLLLPERETLAFQISDGKISFRVPPFDAIAMVQIQYE
jgi:hypothetical protein